MSDSGISQGPELESGRREITGGSNCSLHGSGHFEYGLDA